MTGCSECSLDSSTPHGAALVVCCLAQLVMEDLCCTDHSMALEEQFMSALGRGERPSEAARAQLDLGDRTPHRT